MLQCGIDPRDIADKISSTGYEPSDLDLNDGAFNHYDKAQKSNLKVDTYVYMHHLAFIYVYYSYQASLDQKQICEDSDSGIKSEMEHVMTCHEIF